MSSTAGGEQDQRGEEWMAHPHSQCTRCAPSSSSLIKELARRCRLLRRTLSGRADSYDRRFASSSERWERVIRASRGSVRDVAGGALEQGIEVLRLEVLRGAARALPCRAARDRSRASRPLARTSPRDSGGSFIATAASIRLRELADVAGEVEASATPPSRVARSAMRSGRRSPRLAGSARRAAEYLRRGPAAQAR